MRLLVPEQAACAGTREGRPLTPLAWVIPPVGTVERPRPHTVRVLVCDAHAVGRPGPRPLTVR